jgi:hypothetical protein
MRRRLARGLAVGVASGALLLAPLAAAASAGEVERPHGLIHEFDGVDPGVQVDDLAPLAAR